uniref:DNA-directed DNA polymerase n=1 Tax=Panagrellus redivivus TaxID=6233 RepID=A0A7E4ULZ1_PANRE
MVHSLFSRLSIQEKPKPPKVYNLAAFSPSFQQRVRELALPREAYHLQLADIDGTVDLKPRIDFIGPVYSIQYNPKKGDVYVSETPSSQPVAVKKNAIYDIQSTLHLCQALPSQLKPLYFHQLYNVPKNVILYDSTLDIPFLIALSNSLKRVYQIWIYHSCEVKWPNYNPDHTTKAMFCCRCNQVYYTDVDKRSTLSLMNPFSTNKCAHKTISCDNPTSSKKTKAVEMGKNLFKKFTESKGKGF